MLGVNIQPNPVRFAQLTSKYWRNLYDDHDTGSLEWLEKLGYTTPANCTLVNINMPNDCSEEDRSNVDRRVSLCQECHGGQPWTYMEWMLTTRPGVFGRPSGIANPAGLALILILTVMIVCAHPAI